MFGKKKHSWRWLALWSLLFSGIIYGIARFFMHAVDKEAGLNDKVKNSKNTARKDLFI
jgi:hypothetical protein